MFVFCVYFTHPIVLLLGIITTVVGSGTGCSWWACGNQPGANAASLNLQSVTDFDWDSAGNMYIADGSGYVIWKIDAQTNAASLVGGGHGWHPPLPNEGGVATNGTVSPVGLAIDDNNNVIYADRNHVVRKIDAATGIVTTLVGQWNVRGYSGEEGPAVDALLEKPASLTRLPSGDFVVSEQTSRVLQFTAGGTLHRLAGFGGERKVSRIEKKLFFILEYNFTFSLFYLQGIQWQ